MSLNLSSQQEIVDFIRDYGHDVNRMNELTVYCQSLNSSYNDAGLASSANENVQSEETGTEEDLFQNLIESSPFSKVEQTKIVGETKPTEKVIAIGKRKVFKPKQVVALDRKFHTLHEVAAAYRIGVSTLHKYLNNGLIEGFKIGNQWRFSQSQIDAFESRITSKTK